MLRYKCVRLCILSNRNIRVLWATRILLTISQVEVVSVASPTLRAKLKSGAIESHVDKYPKYTEKAYQLASVGCL